MDDEERRNLAEKLDKDLESFIASKVEECKTKTKGQGSEREQTIDELVAVSISLICNLFYPSHLSLLAILPFLLFL